MLLIAVLATARAARVETPRLAAAAGPVSAEQDEALPVLAEVPAPLLPAPVSRIGYRHGRRQTIEVVTLAPSDVEVEVSTARAFLSMQAAAAKDGIDLQIESGFRTAEQQRELFVAWRKGHGNKAARPGQSNHQSGRALDISVQAPGTYEWLEANAAAFRFKRTVKGEPWHWEYIDVPTARDPTLRVGRLKKTKGTAKAKAVANAHAQAQAHAKTRLTTDAKNKTKTKAYAKANAKTNAKAKQISHAKRPAQRPASRPSAARSSSRLAALEAVPSRVGP